jgi:hypothetical protein
MKLQYRASLWFVVYSSADQGFRVIPEVPALHNYKLETTNYKLISVCLVVRIKMQSNDSNDFFIPINCDKLEPVSYNC